MHRDSFGLVRLLLASLVVVSHTAELVDGDGRREPLERLVGTTNFGFVAVYGFFLVSGYLIAASAARSLSLADFLRRRCARIYPGFVVASLVSVAVVLPLSGGSPPAHGPGLVPSVAVRMMLLQRPVAHGAFAGQHFHQDDVALNGAMWTIPYEFGCYLLAGLLGVLPAGRGLSRRGPLANASPGTLMAGAAAMLLVGAELLPEGIVARPALPLLLPASPRLGLSLLGMFATGACFFLWRDRLVFHGRGALIAAAVLAICVPIAPLTTITLAGGGGYLIFAAARWGGRTPLARIDERTDISYGLYLYAWPIEQVLIRYAGTGNLLLLGIATWVLAAAAGWGSWMFVEHPALRRLKPAWRINPTM